MAIKNHPASIKPKSRFQLTLQEYASVLAFFVFAMTLVAGRIFEFIWLQNNAIAGSAIIGIAISLTLAVRANRQLKKSREPITIREKKIGLVSQIFFTVFCVSFLLAASAYAKTSETSLNFVLIALGLIIAMFFAFRRWKRENVTHDSER